MSDWHQRAAKRAAERARRARNRAGFAAAGVTLVAAAAHRAEARDSDLRNEELLLALSRAAPTGGYSTLPFIAAFGAALAALNPIRALLRLARLARASTASSKKPPAPPAAAAAVAGIKRARLRDGARTMESGAADGSTTSTQSGNDDPAQQWQKPMSPGEVLVLFARAFFEDAQLRRAEWRHSVGQSASILSLYHAGVLEARTRAATESPLGAHDDALGAVENGPAAEPAGLAELLERGGKIRVDRSRRIETMREYERVSADISAARHYMRFASAAYGGVFLAATGLLPISVDLARATVDNEKAVVLKTGVSRDCIVRLEIGPFSDLGVFCPAHFVAVDHASRAIVVTIRGTLSIDDIMTDLVANDADFPPDEKTVREWLAVVPPSSDRVINAADDAATGDKTETSSLKSAAIKTARKTEPWGRVHAGVGRSALVLYERKLRKYLRELLEQLPEYTLVLTGHSLGAGVAIALTVLLIERAPGVRELAEAGRLRCFAFAPPHTIAPRPELGRAERALLEQVMFCVVCHSDLVPRLSARSVLHTLRALQALDEDASLSSEQRKSIVSSKSIRAATEAVQAALRRYELRSQSQRGTQVDEALNSAERSVEDYASLELPGRSVLWLFGEPSPKTASTPTARLASAFLGVNVLADAAAGTMSARGVSADVFDEILLTDGCFRAHFPDSYERALAQVAAAQPADVQAPPSSDNVRSPSRPGASSSSTSTSSSSSTSSASKFD